MNHNQVREPLKVLIFSSNPQDGLFFEHILSSCDFAVYFGQVHTWSEFFSHITAYKDISSIFLEVNCGLKVSSLNILTKLLHHFPQVPVFCYFSDSYFPMIKESILQQGAAATLKKPLRPKKITTLLHDIWVSKIEPLSDTAAQSPPDSIFSYVQTLKTPLAEPDLDSLTQKIDTELKTLSQSDPDSYRTHAADYMTYIYQAFDKESLKDSLSVVYHKYQRQLKNNAQISARQTLSEFLRDCNYIFNFSQKGLNKERIDCAKELIHSFLKEGKTVTLNTIADEMFISPYYLSRSFKRVEGINFIDYLQNSRLEYAKLLLSTSDASIENIAFQCGYNEVNSFRRLFRKKTGVSPNAYRNSLK